MPFTPLTSGALTSVAHPTFQRCTLKNSVLLQKPISIFDNMPLLLYLSHQIRTKHDQLDLLLSPLQIYNALYNVLTMWLDCKWDCHIKHSFFHAKINFDFSFTNNYLYNIYTKRDPIYIRHTLHFVYTNKNDYCHLSKSLGVIFALKCGDIKDGKTSDCYGDLRFS